MSPPRRLIHGLQPEGVADNLRSVRAEIAIAAERAGREPQGVEIVAATKYVPLEEMPTLASVGVTLVGENRAQDMKAKASAYGDAFTWDFIGALQSKHVRTIVPHVRLIHSLASDSAVREIERRLGEARPGLRALVEVNLSGEHGKAGIEPAQLDAFIARCPVPVAGLMTMPPLSDDPESSRPWFRRLRRLAASRGLEHLSMGTTQDFAVAVQEGATIVRIGTRLYA